MTDRAISYKLLGMGTPKDEDELEDDDDPECEVEVEKLFSSSPIKNYGGGGEPSDGGYRFPKGLTQLRMILYITCALLIVVFIVNLSSNGPQDSQIRLQNHFPASLKSTLSDTHMLESIAHDNHKSSKPVKKKPHLMLQHNSTKNTSQVDLSSTASDPLPNRSLSSTTNHLPDTRPEYDSYLSSVLLERNSQSNPPKELMDDLHFPNDQSINLKENNTDTLSTTNSNSFWWIQSTRNSNKYITLTNYIRAMKSFKHNSSITLTTQATTEFMYHTLELCKRWDGPISIAVFCPGKELAVATTLIKFMRQCLPGPLSACIRDKVTWHLVYHRLHGPSLTSYPKRYLDSKNYPLFVHQDQCPKLPGPEPSDIIKQFQEELSKRNNVLSPNYRQQFKLTYPINVLRNTARLAANTYYVLALDIELYPSINLVPSFINYVQKHDMRREFKDKLGDGKSKFIFTFPIFEVKDSLDAPKTKSELIKMIQNDQAVFFHKWVCDACQNFPHRLDWLQTDVYGSTEDPSSSTGYNEMEIKIFEITQRDKSREYWEPIFIGTNEDPTYDDRLTWDGRRDKMAQMYEMCLKNYYLLILGNAFLVHAPGIKHIDKNDTIKRINYIRENNLIYDETIAKLKEQYRNSSSISKC